MRSLFKYDREKALEAILYVAERVPDKYHVLKILYFADKAHLEDYGRLIFGDTYIAMQHGPVPSGAYDILKSADDTEGSRPFGMDGYDVRTFRKADESVFSESDIKMLDESISRYGRLSFGDLCKQSHDAAYKSADFNDAMSLESIIKTLPSGEKLLQHLNDPHPG
ncbi:MAG: Panacea domain-containing protein [Gammaproteobacteria bacterium]